MVAMQHLLSRQDRLIQQLRRQAMAKDRIIKALQDKVNDMQSTVIQVNKDILCADNKSNPYFKKARIIISRRQRI